MGVRSRAPSKLTNESSVLQSCDKLSTNQRPAFPPGKPPTNLDNCVSLLDSEQYPHIATSAHFLLSELYLPDGTDPAMPAFNDDTDARSDDQQSNEGASDESQDMCPQPMCQ